MAITLKEHLQGEDSYLNVLIADGISVKADSQANEIFAFYSSLPMQILLNGRIFRIVESLLLKKTHKII